MIAKRPGPMPDGGAGTLLEASVVIIAVVASIASALAFRRPRRTPPGTPAATPPGTPAATPPGTPAATPPGTPAAADAAGEHAREGQNAAPPMSGSR